jgi:uncharacterized membrane protein YgaE (UPF0421/DUF939 family)
MTVFVQSVRVALAAVASLLIARLFRLPEAYWAPISTLVIVTQPSRDTAFALSWQRFAGTALGVSAGALAASGFRPRIAVFGIGIFLLGLLCARVRLDRSGFRFAGIALAIVLLVPRTASPWQIAFHRFIEVSIGICVAMLFALVWPEKSTAS